MSKLQPIEWAFSLTGRKQDAKDSNNTHRMLSFLCLQLEGLLSLKLPSQRNKSWGEQTATAVRSCHMHLRFSTTETTEGGITVAAGETEAAV